MRTATRNYRRELEKLARAGLAAVAIVGDNKRYRLAIVKGSSVFVLNGQYKTVSAAKARGAARFKAEPKRLATATA